MLSFFLFHLHFGFRQLPSWLHQTFADAGHEGFQDSGERKLLYDKMMQQVTSAGAEVLAVFLGADGQGVASGLKSEAKKQIRNLDPKGRRNTKLIRTQEKRLEYGYSRTCSLFTGRKAFGP